MAKSMNRQFKEQKCEKVNEHIKSCLTSSALREISIFHILVSQNFERLITPNAEEGVESRTSETLLGGVWRFFAGGYLANSSHE